MPASLTPPPPPGLTPPHSHDMHSPVLCPRPQVAYVGKMYEVDSSGIYMGAAQRGKDDQLLGFCKVFCGTLRQGAKMYVLEERHHVGETRSTAQEVVLGQLFLPQGVRRRGGWGRVLVACPLAPLCLILVTERYLWSFSPLTSQSSLRFCAGRVLCPRATTQHSFGGGAMECGAVAAATAGARPSRQRRWPGRGCRGRCTDHSSRAAVGDRGPPTQTPPETCFVSGSSCGSAVRGRRGEVHAAPTHGVVCAWDLC